GSPLVPAARHQGRGAPCGESFWHWALGADGGHGHAQPPFRSSRLIGAERQPTSDCRQSLQQSLLCAFGPDSCADSRRAIRELSDLARRNGVRVVLLGTYQSHPPASQRLVEAEAQAADEAGIAYVEVS